MSDIYATPEADLAQTIEADRAGGNIDDAVAGNIEINMLETLGEAWRGLKGFKLNCLLALLLYMVVIVGAQFANGLLISITQASGADPGAVNLVSFVIQIVITAATLPMSIAVMIMAMRHANNKSVSPGEILKHYGVIISLFVAYLIMMLFILIGMALLVLPGIYLMFAYFFAMPLIVEKKLGPWHALETSRKASTKVWFRLTGLILLTSLINLLGMITIIGWFWTIPWTLLAFSMVYQKMFGVEAHTLAD